jgi:hypothetical protein
MDNNFGWTFALLPIVDGKDNESLDSPALTIRRVKKVSGRLAFSRPTGNVQKSISQHNAGQFN